MNQDSQVRVLNLFTTMNRGGAETMVMNYYRNIDRSKVQFDFMVHRSERAAYDDEIESLGGIIYRMPPIRPWSALSYKSIIKDFYTNHSEYKIIHSHMSELGLYNFIEAEKCGVPFRICHAHNRPYGLDLKSFVRWYYKKKMMSHITNMFVCGEESGEWLFGKDKRKKFIVLNNAVDASLFCFDLVKREKTRKKLDIKNNQLVIGHVGRFDVQKNHKFILDIFASILRLRPNSILMLIGNDKSNIGEEMHDKAKTRGIEEQIRFMGIRDDVPDLMQAMDVFLFPSFFEGLSVASIEAQASGLPVLISDKIPIECKKTDLVKVISLNESAEYWANEVIKASKIPRRNTYQEIVDAGFDIKENAKWLENYYLSLIKGE